MKKGSKVNLLVRRFIVEDGQADIHIAAMPEKSTSANLPRIELSNIGSGKGGASPGEIASQILAVLVRNVGPAVARAGVEQYLGRDMEELKGKVTDEIGRKIDSTVEDTTKKAGEAVKKLLGK